MRALIYNQIEYGFTISCALDLRLVVSVSSLVSDNRIKLKYSRNEVVTSVSDIIHPIIRTSLSYFDYDPNTYGGIEITSTSPIPSGTGLGSSGAFTISLLAALFDHFNLSIPSNEELCQLASSIERNSGNDGIGFQDQYTSCLGNFVSLEYLPNRPGPNILDMDESLIKSLTDFVCSNTYLVKCNQRSALSGSHLSLLNHSQKIQSISFVANSAKAVFNSNPHNQTSTISELIIKAGNISQSIKSIPIDIVNLRQSLLSDKASYVKLLGAGGGGFLFVRLLDSVSPSDIHNIDAHFHKIQLSPSGFLIHQ